MQTVNREYDNARLRTVRINTAQTDKESVRNFCAKIDEETAYLLDEIRNKYSGETNASIIAKAIRKLHDMTCRSLANTYQS